MYNFNNPIKSNVLNKITCYNSKIPDTNYYQYIFSLKRCFFIIGLKLPISFRTT